MKLIIDISEEAFNEVREKKDIDINTINCFIRAIENGTPYDSVIEDIKPEYLNENVERDDPFQTIIDRNYAKGWNACLHRIFKTIDKHISTKESEE